MADRDDISSANDDAEWEALGRHLAGEGVPGDQARAERLMGGEEGVARLASALSAAGVSPAVAPSTQEVEAALASVLSRRHAGQVTGVPSARTPVVSLAEHRSRWRGAGVRAAAAILVVAAGSLVWRAVSDRTPAATAVAAQGKYSTPASRLDSIRLADGTSVILGPGSTLTVSDDFGGRSREVTLQGEGRFTVAHDTARPFVVNTPTASFRDVGTVFAIHSGSVDGARVAVTEGAVAVLARASSDSALLHAGDRASVEPGGAIAVERGVVTTEDVAWTTGLLVLREVSAAEAVVDLKRWYGMDVRLDPSLGNHRVNATFERGAQPRDVARVLAALLGGGVREEAGMFHIVAPGGTQPPR
jgi:transmembrane sensor